jgi:cell division transport system permease protein
MIGFFRTYARRHAHVLRTTLAQLVRAPVASLMTIAVIGITLALPTGLYVLIHNLERISRGWDAGGQISLFLKRDTSDAAAAKLADRIRRIPDVARVDYISRSQALAEFKRLSGFGNALNLLDENPLPPVLVVHPATRTAPEAVQKLLERLRALDAVELAQLDLDWVRRLHAMLVIAERGVLVLAGLLGLAVLLTIGNTIRLAVMNRRDEIEVTKIMGGTNAFIRRPFLYSGVLQGLLGAAMAWLIVALVLWFLDGAIGDLAALYGSDLRVEGLSGADTAVLLGLGAALGWLGSRLSVRRHLRAIEPS